MALLLSRDEAGYDVLREQFRTCRVTGRVMSGAGFFTNLRVDPSSTPAPAVVGNPLGHGRAFADDVIAELADVNHGAGFLLWLEAGRLSQLEGYTFADSWPAEVRDFTVRFQPINVAET